MKNIFIFFISLAYFLPLFAQEWPPPKQTVNINHYKLEIQVDEQNKKVWGDVTYTVKPLWDDVEKVVLDAGEMTINKIVIGTKNIKFDHEGRKLTIHFDRKYNRTEIVLFTISYTAFPKRGTYFVRPDKSYPNKPYQVWTQGESEETHYWFPCYDFPNQFCTTESKITVRKPYIAISNGELLGVNSNKEGWRTFHWKMSQPHVSYLLSLIIGEFIELSDNFEDVSLQYYGQKKDRQNILRSFGKTPKMMRFFSDITGVKYAYKKYAQTPVEEFTFGGMENISATTYTQSTIHDARAHLYANSDSLVAHELAHQWWGNLLTCRDWSQIWLNEGFATYYTVLWLEHDMGTDQAKEELLAEYDWYIGSDKHTVIWKTYDHPDDVFNSHAYAKGAWILHTLRNMIGHKNFVRATQLYLARNRGRAVTTIDLQNAFEDTIGKNLDWFFAQWVYGVGHPKFEASWKWDEENKMVILHVEQTQKQKPFRVTIPIELATSNKNISYRVALEGKEQHIYLPCSEKPLFIAFDKNATVLKELKFKQTEEQYIAQLNLDSDMNGRISAARALAKYPSKKAVAALAKALKKDIFYGVRTRIASLLGKIYTQEANAALLAGTEDKHARVRASVVSALGKNRLNQDAIKTLKLMFRGDLSYRVQARSLKSLIEYADDDTDFNYNDMLKLVKEALTMNSHTNIIRVTALSIYADADEKNASSVLEEWTKYGKAVRCRIKALNAYFEIEKKHKSAMLDKLLIFLKDKDHRMRSAAISLLEELGSKKAIPALIQLAKNDDLLGIQNAATKAIAKLKK